MTEVDFIAVIPARYASTRLPGKPLADIHGRPMIAWVHDRAVASGAARTIVATDDARIVDACREFDAEVILTTPDHRCGTDRIAEVAERLGWADDQLVVNVQGDEPLLPPELVRQVATTAAQHPSAAIATLVTPIVDDADRHNPNFAKVVLDRANRALYFSRAPIPWPRDGGTPTSYRHIGLYAYRSSALRALAEAGPCALERVEMLEQLRALWLGLEIVVGVASSPPPAGVDTDQDLERVRALIAAGLNAVESTPAG
jgi:3-deoxy-manno-octulosonate cytidylyltransferase (CMP-KDO synthetase)